MSYLGLISTLFAGHNGGSPFTQQISNTNNDGRELSSVWQAVPGSANAQITIGNGGGVTAPNNGGFRFENVKIPKSATIASAVISLSQNLQAGATTSFTATWYAWASDNAPQFDSTNRPSVVTRTTASAVFQKTSSSSKVTVAHTVTSIIQEIVNRSGWVSGNAINLMALDSGLETTLSFNSIDDVNSSPSNPASINIAFT